MTGTMSNPARPNVLLAGRTDQGGPVSWAGGVAGDAEIFMAAFEQMRVVENATASHEALVTAYEDWRRDIRTATGEEPPENPMLYIRPDMSLDRLMSLWRKDFSQEIELRAGDVDSKRAEFQQWVNDRASKFPAEATRSWAQRSPEQDARQLARRADERLSTLMESNPGWAKYVSAFAGGAGGALRDPLVTGTLAFGGGPGAAKTVFGRILTVAASEALLNGAVTAAQQPWVQDWRRRAGLSHGFDEAAQNVLFAAGLGGVFGAAGGAIGEGVDSFTRGRGRRQVQDALRGLALTDPELGDTARRAISGDVAAAAELLGEVRDNLPPAVRGALDAMEVRAAERQQLEKAYGTVRDNPTGPARDPLVEITPDDIDKLIVARGSFKKVNELDVSSKRGWGLVKVLWRHGEASSEPPEYQIRRENITALPDVVRDYRPSYISDDGSRREWRVIQDGRVILYADSRMEDGHHLVTAFVERPDRSAGKPMSERKEGAGSFREAVHSARDTGRALSKSGSGGQPEGNIDPLSEADKAAEIARQQERRHDLLMQRAETAERMRQLPDLVLHDPVRVNRLVRELAPRAESISDPQNALGQAPDIDARLAELRNPEDAGGARRPVLNWVRGLGGVKPGSNLAQELHALGINARTAPGLFRKAGRGELDNIGFEELPGEFRDLIGREGTTDYASEQSIIDAIDAEWRADEAPARARDDYKRYLEDNGVDFGTMSEAEIRAQMAAIEEAERRFLAAEPNDLGLSTEEVAFLPPGATRRAYTSDVVSEILRRLGAGVSDDVVKMAADTHIIAGESIEDAIDFAVSMAAGTSRNVPESRFADLPSDPPVPVEDVAPGTARPAPEGEPDPDAIDWAALEEEGFGGAADIPFDGDMVSLEALRKQIEDTEWLENVVEACKL